MSYNTDLQEINADLQAILDTINALPEAGGGGIDFPDTIVAGDTPVIMSSTYSVMCTSSSLKATGMTITVPKDGTYRFRWYMAKLTDSGLSGTYASRLYKNGVAQGSSQSVSGDWGYKSCYVDVACAAGDKVEIYGQCRNVNYPLAVGNLVACIDWDIDWTGESGGSGSSAFPHKVTIVSAGDLTSMTPTLCYGDDGDSLVVLTNTNTAGGLSLTITCENCEKACDANATYNIGSYAIFNNFTGDATITFTWSSGSFSGQGQ